MTFASAAGLGKLYMSRSFLNLRPCSQMSITLNRCNDNENNIEHVSNHRSYEYK